MTTDKSADLLALLDNEREALRLGDYSGLSDLMADKQRLVLGLPAAGGMDPETVLSLRNSAARNQELLSAAASGIKTAMERLKEIRNAVQNLQTYTQAGQVHDLQPQPSLIAKRT